MKSGYHVITSLACFRVFTKTEETEDSHFPHFPHFPPRYYVLCIMASTCANPLLLEWIKEIYDLAKERNTKGVTTYKRAYESMKACPLTFSHPSEAQQLDGIGPKICDRLTERLTEHCEANGLPPPKKPRGKG